MGLATVLIAGCGSASPPSVAAATLFGVVQAAPSCPVERVGTRCPPRPVRGASVEAVQAGDVIASTRTDERGRFQLRLIPGRYLIRATNVGGYASSDQRSVNVRDVGPAQLIRLVVDSGIR